MPAMRNSIGSMVRRGLIGVGMIACGTFAASGQQSVTQLWGEHCAGCHGARGEGVEGHAASLLDSAKRDPVFDRAYYDTIRDGTPKAKDHAFAGKLRNGEVWALVVQIRELQEGERRRLNDYPKAKDGVYTGLHESFRVEPVVDKGLAVPWSVDFLPSGDMLVTERAGNVRVFSKGVLGEPLKGTPPVRVRGQGGMMDVAVHPDYAKNGWVYLSFSDPLEKGGASLGMTKIVRGRIRDGAWVDQQTIFQAKPEHYLPTDVHFGSRIVFSKPDAAGKRYVFFCIGERGHAEFAQDVTRPNGKVYRVWDDGTVPSDNPFVSTKDAYGAIWTRGHRNPQGLSFDLDGNLWNTEHGPRGGDELNLVKKGSNYGWPTVCYGINYSGQPFVVPWVREGDGIAMPAYRWLPSIAACGLDVVRGDAFKGWKGDLLAGGLAGSTVDRLRTGDGKVSEHETLIHGIGRVRDVVCAPDGLIYLVLNGPDKVVRLVPAGK